MSASSPAAPRHVAMFMSVDVVGSTAYKAVAVDAEGRAQWLEAFETLFGELPLIFIGQVAAAGMGHERVPECGVWKVLGDEVVFLGLPVDVAEAEVLAMAFVRTVATYDRRLSARWPLRIRGSCWAADLGGRNRMIEIPEMFSGQHGQSYCDFLGPDVDIGFRLGVHSSVGRVIVSPNLAESLAAPERGTRLNFHVVGERTLKGVCGGQPLPLILMSCDPMGEADDDDRDGGISAAGPGIDRGVLCRDLAARRRALRADHGAVMAPPVFA